MVCNCCLPTGLYPSNTSRLLPTADGGGGGGGGIHQLGSSGLERNALQHPPFHPESAPLASLWVEQLLPPRLSKSSTLGTRLFCTTLKRLLFIFIIYKNITHTYFLSLPS